MKNNFKKYDTEKIRFDLLWGPFIEGMADVMTYGAIRKYDDDNWQNCDNLRRYFSALMRHCWAMWYKKEDIDPESGKKHIYHAGCCLMIISGLLDIHGSKIDNRPTLGAFNEIFHKKNKKKGFWFF